MLKNLKGFTLIEILISIALLAVLFSIVLIAINPKRHFTQSRNTQRKNDLHSMLNAIFHYKIDHNGTLPSGIATSEKNIGNDPEDADICSDLVDVYMVSLPYDPNATGAHYTDCNDYDLQYSISKSPTTGRVTISATGAELDETINITR